MPVLPGGAKSSHRVQLFLQPCTYRFIIKFQGAPGKKNKEYKEPAGNRDNLRRSRLFYAYPCGIDVYQGIMCNINRVRYGAGEFAKTRPATANAATRTGCNYNRKGDNDAACFIKAIVFGGRKRKQNDQYQGADKIGIRYPINLPVRYKSNPAKKGYIILTTAIQKVS